MYRTRWSGDGERVTLDELRVPVADVPADYQGIERPPYIVSYEYSATGAVVSVAGGLEGRLKKTHWKLEELDTAGRITHAELAGGAVDNRSYYHPHRGTLEEQRAEVRGNVKLDREYEWDLVGNLTAREDHLRELREEFTYDGLHRLHAATRSLSNGVVGPATLHHEYDRLGNLTTRGIAKGYRYDGSGHAHAQPHAVTQAIVDGDRRRFRYDASGGITVSSRYEVEWTSYRKPKRITGRDGAGSRFRYGPGRSRFHHEVWESGTMVRETWYVGGDFERIADHDEGEVTDRHYIRAGGQVVAMVDVPLDERWENPELPAPDVAIRYLLRDHQGSVILTVSGHGGTAQVSERMDYEVWGQRRPASGGWSASTLERLQASLSSLDRGYTGHEHLDHLGLIHMNGRVYDPFVGRFLSPDPFVQFPDSTQSFNRYSYVGNNPLSYTDPSGFLSRSTVGFMTAGFVGRNNPELTGQVLGYVGPAVSGLCGPYAFACAAGSAMVSGYLQGASGGQVMAMGMLAVASSGAATIVSGLNLGVVNSGIAHGISQGALSMAGGGRFQDGFLGAAVGTWSSGFAQPYVSSPAGGFAVAVISGGTASKLGGGSFANGAATAAMSYAFGSLAQNGGSSDNAGQPDIMSMSDQELDAYIESQYGDQLNLDTDMLLAECGGCMAQDRMHRAYFAGDATEADLMNLYGAQARGAMWGLGGVGGGLGGKALYHSGKRLLNYALRPGSYLNSGRRLRFGWGRNQGQWQIRAGGDWVRRIRPSGKVDFPIRGPKLHEKPPWKP